MVDENDQKTTKIETDWDKNKENIKPLAEGRRSSEVLNAGNTNINNQIEIETEIK